MKKILLVLSVCLSLYSSNNVLQAQSRPDIVTDCQKISTPVDDEFFFSCLPSMTGVTYVQSIGDPVTFVRFKVEGEFLTGYRRELISNGKYYSDRPCFQILKDGMVSNCLRSIRSTGDPDVLYALLDIDEVSSRPVHVTYSNTSGFSYAFTY